WLHAPSVGESLMSQAIIAELRRRRENVQIVFTHFSPSARRIAERVNADVHDFMPWDLRGDMTVLLDALLPNAIAFVRTEIWPALVRGAAQRGVHTCLVNAVLARRSSRLSGSARWLLHSAYERLDAVGAVARDHAERFTRLGVPESRLHVTGDARFDQVAARVAALDRESPLLKRLADNKVTTVVAGSTWPADEQELVPALASARKGKAMRIIIAPHEPDAAHLRGLEQRLTAGGLKHARLSEIENNTNKLPEVIVVDRLGVLADLYAIANVAYVGGGFHDAGLHSVVEPAALGVPVVFGPRHGNAREADELAGSGGGFVASDGAAVATLILDLAARTVHRTTSSAAARAFVESRLGGAKRNADLILNLLSRGATAI
ncbi:MAG TPA: glycosyltransferase N-terminal domain-containing protein, partial [Longimicrobiales bacterium]